MKVEVAGSKAILILLLIILPILVEAQVTTGRVVFERRINLEKRFKGMEKRPWMRGDMKKPKVDEFELLFNDSTALFRPIEKDLPDEREWMTMQNTTYQNLNSGIRKQEFSFWGTKVLLEDTIRNRTWRMTESKRNIAGYDCRQAVWVANDSTKIYAWYAEELIPSIGPETFNGLPGVILGLAIEDGGVVYFAKEVQVTSPNIEKEIPKGKKKDWYSEEALRELVVERFSSWGAMDRLIQDLFLW